MQSNALIAHRRDVHAVSPTASRPRGGIRRGLAVAAAIPSHDGDTLACRDAAEGATAGDTRLAIVGDARPRIAQRVVVAIDQVGLTRALPCTEVGIAPADKGVNIGLNACALVVKLDLPATGAHAFT